MKVSKLSGKQIAPPTSKPSEECIRLSNDIQIISAKIAELNGDGTQSAYVSSLRTLTSDARTDAGDSKPALIDKILTKVTELERVVLAKTAPEEAIRRNSRVVELSTLPSHMHLINRVLDLHVQAKRVNVVRTTIGGGGDSSASNKQNSAATDEPKQTVSQNSMEMQTLQSKLQELQLQVRNLESEKSAEKSKQEAALKTLLERNDEVVRQLEAVRNDKGKSEELLASFETRKDQLLKEMSGRVTASELASVRAQSRLEEEHSKLQRLVSVIFEVTSSVKAHRTSAISSQTTSQQLPEEAVPAMKHFGDALVTSLQELQNEINALLGAKDSLESELSTQTIQKEMLAADLQALSEECGVVKAAYHALESEALDLRRKLGVAGGGSNNEENMRLIAELQEELAAAARRNVDLEKLPATIVQQELTIKRLEGELAMVRPHVTGLESEIKSYKQLTDSLKAKLRELSTSAGMQPDFLDSFEEVMRDEMHAMKSAFESKLRAAREETEEMAKKHQEQMRKMGSTGRLTPSASTAANLQIPSISMKASTK